MTERKSDCGVLTPLQRKYRWRAARGRGPHAYLALEGGNMVDWYDRIEEIREKEEASKCPDKLEPMQDEREYQERLLTAVKDTVCDRCSPREGRDDCEVKRFGDENPEEMPQPDPPKAYAPRLLDEVAMILGSRGQERDKEEGERTMPGVVPVFNLITGHTLSVEDGWLFMLILKLVRMRGGVFKDDDYYDAIGYASLMAEEAFNNDTMG